MKNNDKINKMQYKKPKLIVIELQSDEVLIIGCKTFDVGTANVASPTNNCNPGVCFEVGS